MKPLIYVKYLLYFCTFQLHSPWRSLTLPDIWAETRCSEDAMQTTQIEKLIGLTCILHSNNKFDLRFHHNAISLGIEKKN